MARPLCPAPGLSPYRKSERHRNGCSADVVLVGEWSPRRDSNPRPAAYKAAALPLSHRGEKGWSDRRDLNPRPPAPEADALPGCATVRRWCPRRELNSRPTDYESVALPLSYKGDGGKVGVAGACSARGPDAAAPEARGGRDAPGRQTPLGCGGRNGGIRTRGLQSPRLVRSQAALSSGRVGRGDRIRTCDIRFWRPALFHLSCTPCKDVRPWGRGRGWCLAGPPGFEPGLPGSEPGVLPLDERPTEDEQHWIT